MKTPLIPLIVVLLVSTSNKAQTFSLEACIAYGLEHSTTLLASAASVEYQHAGHRETIGALLPEISATAGIDNYWKIPVQAFPGELVGQPEGTFVPVRMGTPWTGNYGAEATLSILDPEKWAQLKVSSLQTQLGRSNLEQLQRQIEKNITLAYYDIQLAQKQLETTRERLENYNEIHSLIVHKFEEGITDKITLNQSASLLNEQKLQLSRAQQYHANALLTLRFWMAYPLDQSLETESILLPELAMTSISFDSTALPEYQQHTLEVELARQERKALLGRLYPQLDLHAGLRQTGFGEDLGFVGNSDWFSSGYVGLQLSIPLFSLNNMYFSPVKRRFLIEQTEHERTQYIRSGEQDFIQEQQALKHLGQQLTLQKENVFLATENESLAHEKVQQGIIDIISLKQTQSDLSTAYEQLIAVHREFLQHLLEVRYLQSKNN